MSSLQTQLLQRPIAGTPDAQAEIFRRARKAQRKRRAIAIGVVFSVFLGAAVFWLAAAGTSGLDFGAAPGTASGEIAIVHPFSTTVTRSVGAANLQSGISLGRLIVAEDFVSHIRVTTSWLNAHEAHQVLNNPNAQIQIGIYRPVHTGACTLSETNTHGAIGITDDAASASHDWPSGAITLCSYLDSTALSSPPFDTGKLLLARNVLTGYLRPKQTTSTTALTECTANTTSWCQPAPMMTDIDDSDFPGDQSNQRILYVAASILTPGGIPQGQQNQLNNLSFNLTVKRVGNPTAG